MSDPRVVMVTGASRGFGAAATRLMAERGHTVVATMRDPSRDAARVVAGYEDRVIPVALDVCDPAAVASAVATTTGRFGRIDALVNNAGYGLFGPVEDASEAEVWRQVDTNLLGQWRMMKAVLPGMRARGAGRIVNVSSLAGRIPGPYLGLYAASKHGVEALSESARFELRHSGVQVTVLEPGMFASDWQTTSLDLCEALREGRSPYARAGEALETFRAQGASRPGAGSVAAALADIVDLEQRLPLRWPVGNDSVDMIPARLATPDALWEHLVRTGAFGGWRRWMYAGREAPPPPPGDWGPGTVVLITGASRGFGAAAARECARRGCTVVATMRNPARDAAAVVGGLDERIVALPLDVCDGASVQRAVAETLARFGRIDVVVNNAGYGLYGPVEDLSEEEVRRQIDTNFLGQWRVLKAALPSMRAAGRGKIVNVSSLSGQVPSPLMGFYAAAKHMVEAMSEALRDEVEAFGVQVTTLEPGMYRSDWQTANLDIAAAVREGRSAYARGVARMLGEFRARAATRPGSDAVAQAIADIVVLQQRLPARWPVGEDAVRLIAARRATADDRWEREMAALGWGFRPGEVDGSPA